MKSKIVSISAISSALCAIALTVGAYIELADLFSLVISSVFVVLPLYLNSYKGCFLTYLAGGVIAFLLSGFNIISLVFPSYFAFFGIFPILRSFMIEKKFNKIGRYVISIIWFLAIAYGMYFYYTLIMQGVIDDLPLWITQNVLYFIAPIAVFTFVVYDRFISVMRVFVDKYLGKIVK